MSIYIIFTICGGKIIKKKITTFLICMMIISITTSWFIFTTQSISTITSYKERNSIYQSLATIRGNTYYVSTTGNDNNPGTLSSPFRTIQKTMNIVNPGDTVLVRGGTYNEKAMLKRSGTSSAWITFKNYPNELPIVDGTGITMSWGTGLVQLGDSSNAVPQVSYIIFDGFKIQKAPYNGIRTCFSNHIIIQNCQIYKTEHSGIHVDNGFNIPPWGNYDPDPKPSYIYIYNNYIGTGVNRGWDQEAISICRVEHFEVKYNRVIDTKKEGICSKQGCSYGVIAFNEVACPGPDIYLGAGVLYAHDFEVYNNYCHGAGNSLSISMEQCGLGENYHIYNNIFASSVHGFSLIDENDVCSLATYNVSFINNVCDVGNCAIKISPNIKQTYMRNVVVRNNILKGASNAIFLGSNQPESELAIDHNLFASVSDIYGTDYVTGDPKWINSSAGDYHLQSSSPAIDAGSYIGAPSVDFDGYPRSQGTAIDIGVFEYRYDNSSPNKPSKPSGLTKGMIGQNYTYTTSTTDPEGDQLYYNWSWGDGTYSGWIGPYYSGEIVNQSHSWNDKENYQIKVKAKDILGMESDWSDPLAIKMPKTYINKPIIEVLMKILQRFSFFEKILK